MRIGIIGRSGHVDYAMHEDHPVVALAPGMPDEDMGPLCARCPDATLCEDPHELLKQVDVVAINPPFHAIARWTIAALEAGVPTLAEKPLATDLADLARVEAAVRSTKTPLTTMLPLRYHPGFAAAWEAVQAGAIGTVRLINAQKSYRLGERPPFYHERASYGGTIPWIGAHSIDLLRWFAGCEFEHVTALHSSVGNRDQGDLEVSAHCQFAMEHGIIGATNIDYLRPQGSPTHGDDRVRIAGTDGVIEVIDGTARLIDAEGDRLLVADKQLTVSSLLSSFIAQCAGEGPCPVSADDAIAMTRACLLARQSADSNGANIQFSS